MLFYYLLQDINKFDLIEGYSVERLPPPTPNAQQYPLITIKQTLPGKTHLSVVAWYDSALI